MSLLRQPINLKNIKQRGRPIQPYACGNELCDTAERRRSTNDKWETSATNLHFEFEPKGTISNTRLRNSCYCNARTLVAEHASKALHTWTACAHMDDKQERVTTKKQGDKLIAQCVSCVHSQTQANAPTRFYGAAPLERTQLQTLLSRQR